MPKPANNPGPMRSTGDPVGAGRFTLITELGRGGMCVVWQAWDGELEQEIALKLLLPELRGDAAGLDNLKREVQKSRQLRHPGIVESFDFDKATLSYFSPLKWLKETAPRLRCS